MSSVKINGNELGLFKYYLYDSEHCTGNSYGSIVSQSNLSYLGFDKRAVSYKLVLIQ